MLDLPSSNGDAVAKELGDAARFSAGDVTSADDVAAALDIAAGARARCGSPSTARASATPRRPSARTARSRSTCSRKVVTVNLIGTFNVIRLAAERIAAADEVDGERGVIVNTASVAAFDGQIGQAAYSASKGGIVGMTLPIARDLASLKIRVVTIAPGLFDTPLLAGLPDEAKESLGKQVPHPARLGNPDEYGLTVVADHRQPHAERRDDPPRRRDPDGAALICTA